MAINLKKEPEKLYKMKGTFGYESAYNSFVFKFYDKDKKQEIKLSILPQNEVHMQIFPVRKKQSHNMCSTMIPKFTPHWRMGKDGYYKISLFRLWAQLQYTNAHLNDATNYDFELVWMSQTSTLCPIPLALMLIYTKKNHQGTRFLVKLDAASNCFKRHNLYFPAKDGNIVCTFFEFLNWAQNSKKFTVKTITKQSYMKELNEGKWLWN